MKRRFTWVGLACFAACVVWCLARPNSMQWWYIGGPVTSVVSLAGQFLDIRLARRNAAAAARDPGQDDPARRGTPNDGRR